MPGFEFIDNEEKKAITALFTNNKSKLGKFPLFKPRKFVKKFEEKFANYIGVKYACCVSSGTAALKTSLIAAGIKKGDEVIVQSFTFVAVVEAIIDVGATPILVNVDETLNMCPIELETKITNKTKVIMPVHMLGVAADMDKIKKIAKQNKIIVIDDNCEALGAKWGKEMLGAQSDMCTWSFDNGKTITTGEGGMITTNNKEYYKLCKEYMDHGHENNPKYPRGRDTHRIAGFNFRPTELTGIIGLVQLKKINKIIRYNKLRSKFFYNLLKKYNEISFRKILRKNNPLNDCIIFNFKSKFLANVFVKKLNEKKLITKNVPDAIEWHYALHWDHIFKEFGFNKEKLKFKLKKSTNFLDKSVSIPIFANENINKTKKRVKIIKDILDDLLKKN
jgi:8-amino-3,8-dideoxy-alpha-D-manno-octulosonate transaminase